jgi:hypothetical protein
MTSLHHPTVKLKRIIKDKIEEKLESKTVASGFDTTFESEFPEINNNINNTKQQKSRHISNDEKCFKIFDSIYDYDFEDFEENQSDSQIKSKYESRRGSSSWFSKFLKTSESPKSIILPKLINRDSSKLSKLSGCSSTSTMSMYVMLNPYLYTEVFEILNDCLNKAEEMNNLAPNYINGSLIIHIKSLQKMFIESIKGEVFKPENDNALKNWKLIVNSLKIFIVGFEEQGQGQEKEKKEYEKYTDDKNGIINSVCEAKYNSISSISTNPEIENIPTYHMFRKLYSYESPNEDGQTLINQLNDKLQNLKLNIL